MLACMEQAPDIRYIPLEERLPDPRMQRAVEGMRVHGTLAAAARFAGVDRRTVRRWREVDETFAEEMSEAYEEHSDECEEELHRRAFIGDEQVQYHQGQPIIERDPVTGEPVLDDNFEVKYYVRKVKSDQLVPIYLKSRRLAYRDKADLTLMGPGGGPIKTDTKLTVELVKREMPSIEELEEMYGEKAQEARAAGEG